MRGQNGFRHAEQARLGGIGIGHKAGFKNGGSAGLIGDALGEETAGAGFGRDKSQPRARKTGHDYRFQTGNIHTIDHVTETFANGVHKGRRQGPRGIFIPGLGGDAHEHFPLRGVGGGRGIAAPGQVPDAFGGRPLADAERADHGRHDDRPRAALQKRAHASGKHGQKLGRRTRQEKDELLRADRHRAAGRGADAVGKNLGPARQQRLLELVRAHGARAEIFPEPRKALRIFLKRVASHACRPRANFAPTPRATRPQGAPHYRPPSGHAQGQSRTPPVPGPHGPRPN